MGRRSKAAVARAKAAAVARARRQEAIREEAEDRRASEEAAVLSHSYINSKYGYITPSSMVSPVKRRVRLRAGAMSSPEECDTPPQPTTFRISANTPIPPVPLFSPRAQRRPNPMETPTATSSTPTSTSTPTPPNPFSPLPPRSAKMKSPLYQAFEWHPGNAIVDLRRLYDFISTLRCHCGSRLDKGGFSAPVTVKGLAKRIHFGCRNPKCRSNNTFETSSVITNTFECGQQDGTV